MNVTSTVLSRKKQPSKSEEVDRRSENKARVKEHKDWPRLYHYDSILVVVVWWTIHLPPLISWTLLLLTAYLRMWMNHKHMTLICFVPWPWPCSLFFFPLTWNILFLLPWNHSWKSNSLTQMWWSTTTTGGSKFSWAVLKRPQTFCGHTVCGHICDELHSTLLL